MVFIKILKMLNKKIVWTVHNNMPHELINEKETKKIMKFMAKNSDRIHILCNETVNTNQYLKEWQSKIVYIPHGDYINCYDGKDINIYDKYNIPLTKKIILFAGQIKKYKNIELLIKAFIESKLEDNNYVLLICGKCNDEVYKEELKKITNDNIFFDFRFIADEEMGSYLNASEIIVAPYNKKSSLNSGTLWMCMSYSKTMALPLIGCVKDVKNYNDFLYTYDYSSEVEHYDALLKCLLKIKSDLNEDNNILKEKGQKAYDYITNNQTWELLKEKWIDLYKF
jgi:glycosyltransferase involved in cell wall biosynthesis